MLLTLLKFINPLKAVAKELTEAYLQKQNAETERDRIHAEVVIQQLEARQKALSEGQWTWVTKLVQALWAFPFILYTSKVIVWDKVLGWGVTDPLGPYEQNIGYVIVGFFFLSSYGPGIIKRIKN